jgi:hypothetical protein
MTPVALLEREMLLASLHLAFIAQIKLAHGIHIHLHV